MSLQVMKYTFKGRNDFTSDFQNKREIDCGMHYLNPNFNTIIGIYENKDNIKFDVFESFKSKCPNCESDIIESSCYNCCHDKNCGIVNYINISLGGFRTCFYYNYPEYAYSIPIENLYGTGTFHKFKEQDSKMKHHICKNCYYEFFIIPR